MAKQKKWLISLQPAHYIKAIDGGEEKIFLIGYEQGKKVRKVQLYSSQKDQDNYSLDVRFEPEPDYVSYSFFLGFFESSVKNLNFKVKDNEELSRSEFKKIFNNKYDFNFKNTQLNAHIKNYVNNLYDDIYV